MENEKYPLTISVTVRAETISKATEKMESFTRLVAKLSEEDACRGMAKLNIDAEIFQTSSSKSNAQS